MNIEVKNKLMQAGKIGRDALEYGKSLAEPGAYLLDIAERYICIRGGQPLTSDEIISPDDDVQVLEIFSGGM